MRYEERIGLAVVDDVNDINLMVEEFARQQQLLTKFMVHGFLSGRSFLNAIKASPAEYAGAVMDFELGERLSGAQIAELAREYNPSLKIIVCTGYPQNYKKFAALNPELIIPKHNLYPMLHCIFDLLLNSRN